MGKQVTKTCNPHIQEAEAEFQDQGQSGLHSKTLSKKRKQDAGGYAYNCSYSGGRGKRIEV
jgi:hypothetical protein